MAEPPLLAEFMELRKRGFSLGIRDYLALLDAMHAGYGIDSRRSLLFTCETLWGKSHEEQIRIRLLLDHMLGAVEPRDFTEPPRRETAHRDPETTPAAAGLPRSPGLLRRMRDFLLGLAGRSGRPATTDAAQDSFSEPEPDLIVESTVDLGGVGEAPLWQASDRFELEPREPVPSRTMRQIWRGYRRAGRHGPKIELDVEAAIAQLAREGMLLDPPMRAARSNRARLLLLVDQGGSMAPFNYITRGIVRSARMSSIGALEVRYFHDVPSGEVYREPDLSQGELLEQVAASFVDQGVMILSDAGAARGDLDETRVEATAAALAELHDVTPTVVWLNPVPRRRWRGSSARAIVERSNVPMFAFGKVGMRAAVSALHGRHA